jgi:hypothetical protein
MAFVEGEVFHDKRRNLIFEEISWSILLPQKYDIIY